MSGVIEPIAGRYLHLDHAGPPSTASISRRAGSGIPLVCLHTAGVRYAAVSRADERRRESPTGFRSSPSTCRGTANRRRPRAGRTRNTA